MSRLPLLLFLGALLVAAPAAAQEGELKSGDARKLGKPLGDWVSNLVEGKSADAAEAKTDLVEAVETLQKKMKDRAVLSLTRDWERLLDESRDYETGGAWIKKGKATTHPLGPSSFTVWLPDKYNPKKEIYPVLLLLDASTDEAALAALPAEILESYVILAPTLRAEDASSVVDRGTQVRMLGAIAQASIHFRIDRSRVYAVAAGEVGCGAAADLVAAFPHFFAGLALVGAEAAPKRGAKNLALLPVSGGLADLAAAVTWCGEAEARFNYPTEFSFELTREWAGRAYWVHATEFDVPEADGDEPSSFSVKVDAATNTITLDSKGVYTFALYLNDEIVDLDREVTVVRNGEPYKATFSRTIGTLLTHFEQAFDSGAVFPVLLRQLDVPQPAAPDAPADGGGN